MLTTGIELEACCGCGACNQVCPFHALEIEPDTEGFLRAKVDLNKCVNCGLCAKVCPMNSQNVFAFKRADCAIALVHKNSKTAFESSSGGAFSAIATAFIGNEKCVIFGAEAKGIFDVAHRGIFNLAEISAFRKSKYIPSDTLETFTEAKKILQSGGRVLFSGAPCQIAALKLFVGKKLEEHLFTIDFSCHGVGSVESLKKYIDCIEKQVGKKVVGFDFRAKARRLFTFSSQCSKITFEDGSSQVRFKDAWFKGFVSALYKNSACKDCPFSQSDRISDVTIADFWGIERISKKWNSGRGVSLVLLNSKKAKKLLPAIKTVAEIEEFAFEEALKYNIPLRKKVTPNPKSELFKRLLKTEDFEVALDKVLGKPTFVNRCVGLVLSCLPIRAQHRLIGFSKKITGAVKKILRAILPQSIFQKIMQKWATLNGRSNNNEVEK